MRNLSDLLRQEPEESAPVSSLVDIFDEEPVPLGTFISDAHFLANPPLSPIQFEAVKHIERVYYPDLYPLMGKEFDPYWAEPVRMTNFITLQWGKGSGKDHICRVASLRIAYLLLCLKSPQEYLGLPGQDTIHMLNIAASAPQAYQAFFAPITRVVKRGWFKDNCEPRQNLISYRKNVEVISGNSDAETQEGLNLMLGIADEIDAFRSKAELERYRGQSAREPTKSAEGILRMMRTSASTRFPETFKNVRISFPRYLGSTIQNLTDQAKADNEKRPATSRHYVSGPKLTWEVNPRFDKFSKISIPATDVPVPDVASIVEDYEEDPAMAKAMYECRPSRAIDTYFKNMAAIRACVDRDTQPLIIDYATTVRRSEVTGEDVTMYVPTFTFDNDFRPVSGANYAIHADLAIKQDCAGVAMTHVSSWGEYTETSLDEEGGEVEVTESRPTVKVDFSVNFSASLKVQPPREIQIRWVRQLVFELIRRGFPIAKVTYDGFQSTDSMQILESHGLVSERASTDLNEDFWKTFRDVAYDGRLSLPYSARLLGELESLGRFSGKVDHPIGGSKDEADAVVCSIVGAIEVGGEEAPEDGPIFPSEVSFKVGGLDDAELVQDEEIDLFSFNPRPDYDMHVRL